MAQSIIYNEIEQVINPFNNQLITSDLILIFSNIKTTMKLFCLCPVWFIALFKMDVIKYVNNYFDLFQKQIVNQVCKFKTFIQIESKIRNQIINQLTNLFQNNLSNKMTSKFSILSPAKKNSKKATDLMQQQMFSQTKKKQFISNKNSPFAPEGQKINFESEDSQGSDMSYESSIQSQEDINIGQIQYFKEQMGRFFINYPELINNQIIDDSKWDAEQLLRMGSADNVQNAAGHPFGGDKQSLNKNWTLIADQILSEAKDSSSFLQSLSRRIALYRAKVQQQDLIDLLLKQQKNIMKQIDLQINLKKKENKGTKNTMEQMQGCQNMYFSWRKKKQMENRLNLPKDEPVNSTGKNRNNQDNQKPNFSPTLKNHQSTFPNRNFQASREKNQISDNSSKPPQVAKTTQQNSKLGTFFITSAGNQNFSQIQPKNKTFSRTFHQNKAVQRSNSKNINQKAFLGTANSRTFSLNKNSSRQQQKQSQNKKSKFVQEEQKENKASQGVSGQTQTFWKHLVNFEPRTQAGRQLCQLIRKTNSPNDQLGIKKTIMMFLSRSKQMVQNQVILKSTISQKIQKLYNDDSKQLLMFYPTKMSTATPNQPSSSNNYLSKDQLGSENKRNSNLNTNPLISSQQYRGQNQQSLANGSNLPSSANNYPNMRIPDNLDANNKLFDQGEKFISLLEDIVEGPLMKYWVMIQQNKL